jgi:hypothetical protein
LRHANFVVQGPTTTLIIIGDDNPDATVLTHRVPEGAYTIFLQEGWSLELLDADAGATVVAAELSSPNPTPFAVLANQHTEVQLSFRVGDDVVQQGTFGVSVGVDDNPAQPAFCSSDAECSAGATCCLAGFLGTCVTLQDAQACPLPDLTIDQGVAAQSLFLDHAYFAPESCALAEGCVDAPGNRAILRFDTQTPNIGEADMILGAPGEEHGFEYSSCHGHYHFEGYAQYEVLDVNGNIAASGHKQAFCLLDLAQTDPAAGPRKFHCGFQGISRGWSDIYDGSLDCQWVDVTALTAGDYTLRIRLNPDQILPESDYTNNVAEIPFNIGNPQVIDPLQPCTGDLNGLNRDCGWSVAPGFEDVACEPGTALNVGCGCGVGSCTGDMMVRICDGATPCDRTTFITQVDDSCGYCPQATLVCPDSGHYSVLTAPYNSTDTASVCSVDATASSVVVPPTPTQAPTPVGSGHSH